MGKETREERTFKYAAIAKMEEHAKKGSVIAYRDLAELLGGSGRRNLVDTLDSINEKTYRKQDILLSAVVVGDNGMPDSGFFDKFRVGRWPLVRWEGRNRDLDSRAIFREELAAVYERYDAREKVYVCIDLENASGASGSEWQNPLNWLRERGYRVFGVACTKHKNQKAQKAKEWLAQEFDGIEFRYAPTVGKKGQEADAAILIEFGRATHRVTIRDFVCFIAGADKVYKAATKIALGEGMKVLRFCNSEAAKWNPKSKGFYRSFDINASPESWDVALDKLVGD